MADVKKLFEAAIQAVDAGAPDLAADFADRALRSLRSDAPESPAELPWSTQKRDERFTEFLRRGAAFLDRFAEAPGAQVGEDEARAFARECFAEQPRVVGPSFYRKGALETEVTPNGPMVRLTKAGYQYLKQLKALLERADRHRPVY